MPLFVGNVVTVPPGTTDRITIRPPAGKQFLVNMIACERAAPGGGKFRLVLSRQTGPAVFLDATLAESTGSFVVTDAMELTNAVFVSLVNPTPATWRVGFTGMEVAL